MARVKKQEKAGRPPVITDDVWEELCARISEGRSVNSICKDADMPDKATFYRHLARNENCATSYMRAKESSGHAHADRIIEVVDLVSNGDIEANSAKAMMDGLKWAAERLKAKYYMPQKLINHESPGGTMTPVTKIERVIIDNKHDEPRDTNT